MTGARPPCRFGMPALAGIALAACATTPVSVEVAMAECAERARAATKPSGSLGIGVNSEGTVRTGISIGVSSDFLAGRDPEDVYNECVLNKSGQPPTRPLVL